MTINYLALSSGLSGNLPVDGGGGSELASSGSVAVIDIFGPLVHRTAGGMMAWLCGEAASYERIGELFSEALYDDSVQRIVLNLDSPGGSVSGVYELADLIYESRGVKPIDAMVNESALSAGYLIASAADRIVLPRTGEVGSIGVLAVHVDRSAMEEGVGLKFTEIYAGDRKVDGSPHGPLTKEAFAEAQKKVNTAYDLFVKTVARNRGLTEKAVRNTQAAIYMGAEALGIGLADEISTFTELRRSLMSLKTGLWALVDSKSDAEIGAAMATIGYVPKGMEHPDGLAGGLNALLEGKKPDEIATAMASVGFVARKDAPADLNAAVTTLLEGETPEAVAEALQAHGYVPKGADSRVEKVLSACQLGGVTDLGFVMGLIKDKVSVDDAKEKILKARADGTQQIFSTVSGAGTGDTNLLLKDARQRAGKDGE